MSGPIKNVAVLVEGQTEERFIKDVFARDFSNYQIYFYPIILTTKRIKDGPDFKGGGVSFGKFKNDLMRLLRTPHFNCVTTLFDYYALSVDFPGMDSRPRGTGIQRVEHVEKEVKSSFSSFENFLPFFALHEFEAWLYSDHKILPGRMNKRGIGSTEKFEEICKKFSMHEKSPEDINERADCTPSKRILNLFPEYRKTLHGPIIINDIGINTVRKKCPHFNDWVAKLESLKS